MNSQTLYTAVSTLAARTHAFSDVELGQPFPWRAHQEGARFALLGTYHELRDLAVELSHERASEGPAVTVAQRALGQYHTAYRELQAILLGVSNAEYDRAPAPGEWPLRNILGHIVGAERTFFSLVHYGLARQRDGGDRPSQFPEGEVDRVVGPFAEFIKMLETYSLEEMLASYDELHGRALSEFAGISDEELAGPSLWWEGEEVSLSYRLHRFDAHLRQHTIQAEKTLAAIGRLPSEASRLLRLIYNALAEVENATLGAAGVGSAERTKLAQSIFARSDDVSAAIAQAREMASAVQTGDMERVGLLLDEDPKLVNATDENGLPLVVAAAYRRNGEMVERLVEAGATLYLHEGAAIGRLDIVQRDVERWPEDIDEYTRDGFTPLQLACFFGHEEIALWLIEQGADVNLVAQNPQGIQAIHAAAAIENLTVLWALLEHGADVNARQQSGVAAIHTAAHRGNLEMTQLLLDFGADIKATTDDGKTPLDFAHDDGYPQVAELLEQVAAG